MIYLDYSANTPADPAVLDCFCEAERACCGNANAAHSAGRAAKACVDEATASVAALLGVQPEEIIYTSGASEANNTAIFGLARAGRHVGRHIISTPLEHPSVSGCLTALQEQGYEIDLVGIGRDGKVDLEQLQELLRRDTVLVSITAVDSELGTVQPVGALAQLQRALDARGVCVSVKSACSAENTPSRAVFAVRRSRRAALSSLRISLSHLTTQAELEAFMEIFTDCCREMRQ